MNDLKRWRLGDVSKNIDFQIVIYVEVLDIGKLYRFCLLLTLLWSARWNSRYRVFERFQAQTITDLP